VPSSEVQDVTATFIGSDNYTVTVDPSEFNTCYYYPASGNPVQVVPFIATEEADSITTDPTQLGPSECLRNFYGQADVGDETAHDLDKSLKEIDITYPIPTPTVSGVSPTSGSTAGGEAVTITGAGFTGATAVSFGTVALTSSNFTVNSDTSITATVPAGSAGEVNVTVTTPGGTSATSTADQFSFTAPAYILGDVNGDGKVTLADA
jgi:hypothetical protein